MTEKEFSKLKRHELLQLLLAQGQEQKRLEEQMADMTAQLSELETGCGRLKEKLDDKDAQIERLKEKLDDKDIQIGQWKERLEEKDAQIAHLKKRLEEKDTRIGQLREEAEQERAYREIQLEESGSIAEAALRLNGIFETAQKAVDLYTENVRLRYEKLEAEIAGREADCRRRCEALEASTREVCRSLMKSAREKEDGQVNQAHE